MRCVQRPDTPPDALSHPAFQRMRQDYLAHVALDPGRRRQTRPPDRHLSRVPDLDDAIRRFFHDKCAFCESRAPVSPCRFQLNLPPLVESRLAAAEREGERTHDAVGSLLHDRLADLSDIFPDGLEFTGFLESLARAQAAERTRVEQAPPIPTQEQDWSDPPFLTRGAIKGFKGLEDLSFDRPAPASPDDPAPALLILCENAAGKSSILEAIALTLSGHEVRKAVMPTPQELLLNPLFMGGTQATFHEGLVSLTFQTRDGKRRVRLGDAGLHGSAAIADLPVLAYGADRHDLRDYLDWLAERGSVSLLRSDSLLSNPEKWLISPEDTTFDDKVAALRSIFGPGGGFERTERASDRCMVVTRPEADMAEAVTPLSSVSAGFRTILAPTGDLIRWLTDPARG